MADVPIITASAASGTSYGDRMVVSFTAEQPVYICITDDEKFYPFPTDTSNGDCNLFFNR